MDIIATHKNTVFTTTVGFIIISVLVVVLILSVLWRRDGYQSGNSNSTQHPKNDYCHNTMMSGSFGGGGCCDNDTVLEVGECGKCRHDSCGGYWIWILLGIVVVVVILAIGWFIMWSHESQHTHNNFNISHVHSTATEPTVKRVVSNGCNGGACVIPGVPAPGRSRASKCCDSTSTTTARVVGSVLKSERISPNVAPSDLPGGGSSKSGGIGRVNNSEDWWA